MPIQTLVRGLLAASIVFAISVAAPSSSPAQEKPAPKSDAPASKAPASKSDVPKSDASKSDASKSGASKPDPAKSDASSQKNGAPAAKSDTPQDTAKRPRLSRTLAAIEPLRETVDQIETSLRTADIGDSTLVQHRGRLEPVRDELREIASSLEGRLTDVETRLKQLGEAPEEGETKEDPALAEERTRLEERRAALDGALKQVRLLTLRADNMSVRITERRRALFTQQLLGRTSSVLDPAFWTQAIKAAPDAWNGVRLVAQGWADHLRANVTEWKLTAAGLALFVFFAGAALFLRWFVRRDFRPKELGTRFAKSFFALLSLIRFTITAPAIVLGALLILNAFGLLTERVGNIGLTLAIAVAVAAFGRGVAVGLFAPGDPDRRLLSVQEETAGLIAANLIWAARILGAVILINAVLQTVVAPVVMTIATNAIFASLIVAMLCRFLFLMGSRESLEDDVAGAGWLRSAGWLLVIGIAAALVTGFIGLSAFLAGRFLAALGLIGALYILLTFIDALFTEVLTASSSRGRAVANFFGLKPRSIGLLGTLLSAIIRLLLVLVVLMPLLGPWGIFAADFVGVLKDATFGFRIGELSISLTSILIAVAIVLVGTLATRAVQAWLNTRFLPQTTLDTSLQNSISTIFGYLGVIAAISLALAQLGVDFQRITLVAGALSIGIGFGLQSVVSNFVSGLILLAERPIRVGDIISVKGEEGRVRRIHVRATEIETGDRSSVIIPNSELITQVVKNRTHTDTFARVAVALGVAYDSDVAKVRDVLLEIAKAHPHVMQSPAPSVLLTGFGDSAINFELGWVVRNLGDSGGIKSEICFAILERFRAEGIVMPYPQRQIYIQGLGDDHEAEPESTPREPKAPKKPKAR
jgi:small-conductance mechanosensitive channel